jgi:hypothetical protein
LLPFFTFATGRGCGFFHFLIIILYIFNKFFGTFFTFFTFLRAEGGSCFFKNLLKGEGTGLISLFWEKKLLKDGNGRWVGCEFVF